MSYYKKYVDSVNKKFIEQGTTAKERCNELIIKYNHLGNNGICNKHLIPKIYETIVAWLFRLQVSNPKTFVGYDIEEDMGMIYEYIPMALSNFKIESNVPFHLYFQRYLWGHLLARRKRENKIDDTYSGDLENISVPLVYLD